MSGFQNPHIDNKIKNFAVLSIFRRHFECSNIEMSFEKERPRKHKNSIFQTLNIVFRLLFKLLILFRLRDETPQTQLNGISPPQ